MIILSICLLFVDDRIIQINSINLEEVQHEEAVGILQEAPVRCLLVLGRRQCIPKLVSHYPPMAIFNKTVPAEDMYPKEFVKEHPEKDTKVRRHSEKSNFVFDLYLKSFLWTICMFMHTHIQ